MCARSHGAAELSDCGHFANAPQSFFGTAKLIVHQSQLEPECGGLGMNAMAAANARGELMFLRASCDDLARFGHVAQEDVRALDKLDGEGRVHHIAGREPEMEPAAGV